MDGYGYPKELFKGSVYRVTFSPEEHASLNKQGWSDEATEDTTYVPHTAAPPEPSPVRKLLKKLTDTPAPAKA